MSADGNSATQYSFMLSAGSPGKRKFPDLRNVFYHVIRLFFRPYRLLQLELAVAQPDSVHSQVLTGTVFAGGTVADDENLSGHHFCSLLNLAKGCFLGQHIIAVSEIDSLDGPLTIQPQNFHFCVLDLRFAKADNEISYAAFSQKAQQRQ
jgi:hypothetical protein